MTNSIRGFELVIALFRALSRVMGVRSLLISSESLDKERSSLPPLESVERRLCHSQYLFADGEFDTGASR